MARYIPGGRVVLADGTYEFGGPVSLDKQKAHLQGMGGSTHIRPSTTGFSTLLNVDDVHVRVGYLLLLDTGDSQHDLRYAVRDIGQFWTVVEHVHTHGAEFGFDGSIGPAIIQLEHHGSSTGGNAGQEAIGFTNDPDGFGVQHGRVHGGWIENPDRRAVLFFNADECTIEGMKSRTASREAQDTYDQILLSGGTANSNVLGCPVQGVGQPRYALREDSDGTNNAIVGNRATGGATGNLSINGSGSGTGSLNFT